MLKKYFAIKYWRGHRLLLFGFLLVHFLLTLIYVRQQPLLNDESDYLEYSKRWLMGQPSKVKDVDDSKTPVVAIAWLPRIYKQLMNKDMQLNDWGRSDQVNGRYMMIVFFWGVLFYVYLWGKKLYGKNGWIIPLLLLIIDPLFMAFSPIVNSDMACVFVLLAVMYHAYNYSINFSWKQFVLMSSLSGVALLTKSSLIFIPLILVIIFITRTIILPHSKRNRKYHFLMVTIYIFICWLVVNGGYYFYHSFQPWSSYNFQSSSLISIFGHLDSMKSFPRLLPEPFIQGYDLLLYHKEQGPYHPDMPYKGVFILDGKYATGVWFYYIVQGFFKLPIGLLLLFLLSVIYSFKSFRAKAYVEKYQFLLVPVVVYGFALSFINPFQQGIRHAMIIFPFLFLAIGYLWQRWKLQRSKMRLLVVGCIAYNIISVAAFYPDIMHYTNELIPDKKRLFHYIAEFNYRPDNIPVDTKPFIDKHPGYRLAPMQPATGKFIIPGAYVYNSTYEVYKDYSWLKKYEPTGIFRNVFLVYDIGQGK